MTNPYYADDRVSLYLGDMREVLPSLGIQADLIVTDPPYQETSLAWDKWPDGWPALLAAHSKSMWCFGSMRMFLDRRDEFTDWKLSQDVVWEKHNGSGFATDRFRRVHEHALHWYVGNWADTYHDTPTVPGVRARNVMRRAPATHTGQRADSHYVTEEGGPMQARSVIYARSEHGRSINPTQKPSGMLRPLIQYGPPPHGLVLDPFAGSGSTLITARTLGMRAVGVEMREEQCESAALLLSQDCLDFGEPA